jgi:hypothetical protein
MVVQVFDLSSIHTTFNCEVATWVNSTALLFYLQLWKCFIYTIKKTHDQTLQKNHNVSTKYNVLVEIAPGSSLPELKLHLEIVIST